MQTEQDLNPVDNGETTEETSENVDQPSTLSLEEYNQTTGKNYKSWDDVAKSEKERDKLFSDQGNKKQEQETETSKPPVVPTETDLAEEVLEMKHPESVHVKEELEEISQKEGISKYDAFKKYSYLQKEAKAEEAKQKGEAINSINTPSGRVITQKNVADLTPQEVQELANKGETEKVLAHHDYLVRTNGGEK